MIALGLVLWGATLTIELFTGYLIVEKVGAIVEAFFPILMMLVGMVFMFITDKEKKHLEKWEMIVYQGYEIWVYYASYIVNIGICLCIILNVYHNISMVSPVLMLTWLLPMVSYSMYNAVILFDKKEFRLANKKISYKEVNSIKIERKKRNRACIYVHCKHKSYYYSAKNERIDSIKEILLTHNSRIKIQ